MKGKTKATKVHGFMRVILAANVKQLMEKQFASESNKPKALSKAAHVSLSTVQRVLDQSVGASLDSIEAIATTFGLSSYQLLVPNLKADNPQVVKGAFKEEEKMYAGYRRERIAGRTDKSVASDT